MIHIYTNLEKYNKKEIIIDNDGYFDENVTAESFMELERDVIRKIDNAEILDTNTGAIMTPRGIGALENLSSGCKTVLNCIFLYKNDITSIKAVDASQCGVNALEVLFDTIEYLQYQIDIVLRHKDDIFECKERDYVINGIKKIKNLMYM